MGGGSGAFASLTLDQGGTIDIGEITQRLNQYNGPTADVICVGCPGSLPLLVRNTFRTRRHPCAQFAWGLQTSARSNMVSSPAHLRRYISQPAWTMTGVLCYSQTLRKCGNEACMLTTWPSG